MDDDFDVRVLLSLILDAAGYDISTAADAYEAFFLLEHTKPDLLLVDLMMADWDGWDVIDAVRTNPKTRELPIVVMSAKIGLINTRDHGVQGYISKPIVPLAMLDTLAAVLQETTPTDR